MNRFQRYIFSQVAVAVSLSIGLFIFVLVTGNVLRQVLGELASGRLDWLTFFQIIGLLLLGLTPYALPIGVLTGVLLVLGRMSAQNEILAMKAAGLSLWRIVSPIFFIALIGVIFSLFINFQYAPLANDTQKRLLRGAVRDNPSSLLAAGEFTRFKKGFLVYPETREGDELRNVWLWELNDTGGVSKVIRAETATFNFSEGNGTGGDDVLEIIAKNALVENRHSRKNDDVMAPISIVNLEKISIAIPQILEGIGEREKKLKHYTFSELVSLRKNGWKIKDEITLAEKLRGYKTRAEATPAEQFADRIAVQLQLQGNLANALGVLSLTMLAIPLGIKTSRSETLVNIAIALALALTFYVLTVSVSWIKNPEFRPDILVWVPNFLFQILGFVLLRRAAKN